MSRHIRMPGGGYTPKRPDRLQLLMEGYQPSPPTIYTPKTSESRDSSGKQTNYDTKDFQARYVIGQRATVFGAGSVGSHLLTCMGSNQLRVNVVDNKHVEAKHLYSGRTAYHNGDIGLRKVDAIKRLLERDYPGTQVTAYPYDVAELPDAKIKTMLAESKVVVVAIDDPEQVLRISDLAYSNIVPLIQVALHRQAKSGHIAISLPSQTPCLRCTLGIRGDQQIHRLNSEAANSQDILVVAQQAARMAVDIIHSVATGQPITRWDTSKNLIYIANTRQELSPDGPGLHHEGSTRRPDCPICGRHRNLF